MKERPILFSAPMVRAILAGTKTQTRRGIKDQSIGERFSHMTDAGLAHLEWLGDPCCGSGVWDVPEYSAEVACPYGRPGDRLWVREAHSIGPGPGVPLQPGETAGALRWPHVTYLADGAVERRDMRWKGAFGVSRPSIHMPRWASRITLEVTSVRVERLQDISEADAQAEGCPCYVCGRTMDGLSEDDCHCFHRKADASDYRSLWEQINGPDSWAANPWVWVVEFKLLVPPKETR